MAGASQAFRLMLEAMRAPRQAALDTAEKNAVKLLGMEPGNTGLERAAEQGYNMDLYHGGFRGGRTEASYRRSNPSGHAGRGFYTTPSTLDIRRNYTSPLGPDPRYNISEAMNFEGMDPSLIQRFEEGQLTMDEMADVLKKTGMGDNLGVVYPLKVRGGTGANLHLGTQDINPGARMDVIDPMAAWRKAVTGLKDARAYGGLPREFMDMIGRPNVSYNDVAKRLAGVRAYDPDSGVAFGNYGIATQVLKDLGAETFTHPTKFPSPALNVAGSHTIVLEPSAARSRFAAFDPAKPKDPNLLASVFPLTTGATAATLAALREPEVQY